MDQGTTRIFFALLRSAICGTELTEEERGLYNAEQLPTLWRLASKHDVAHLLAFGIQKNGLIAEENGELTRCIMKAVYRYERLNYDYELLCSALEEAKIPFLPLKGAVLRGYYPEAWMRTSCDIDVLVHREDLDRAVAYLTQTLQYEEKERATHDLSLYTPAGVHVELHFDLVEEGRANRAMDVLRSVWDNVSLQENLAYGYEMSDAFFYFYHIAHMAKHFECGGCGIRPFLDLWILEHVVKHEPSERKAVLARGDLLAFAEASIALSEVWLGGHEADALSTQMQNFIFHGGVYGSSENRVALQQKKQGGRMGYVWSRIFVPYDKLRRYYPILEKHRWLMPFMQIRRWFMLLKPDVAKMAKREMTANGNVDKAKAEEMNLFLKQIGL